MKYWLIIFFIVNIGFGVHRIGANDYPNRPIRMIVPIAPGGGTDVIARFAGQVLSLAWKQPVIIDNRPGAGGIIGMRMASQAPPDGYTLVTGNIGSISITPSLYRSAHFDTLRDFEPVCLLATAPIALVSSHLIKELMVKDLIEAMKQKPERFSIASSGIGQSTHLAAELFRLKAGIKSAIVPYRGAAPAITDLLANNVQLIFDATQALPYVKSGKLRAMAVTTEKRSEFYPGVPTMAEAGMNDFIVSSWFGVLAPKGTSRSIIEKLSHQLMDEMPSVQIKQTLHDTLMSEVSVNTPNDFRSFISKEMIRWRQLIQTANLQVE